MTASSDASPPLLQSYLRRHAIEKKIAETPANAKKSTNKRKVVIQYRTSHQLTAFCARALAARI
jgi:hypothetical protein